MTVSERVASVHLLTLEIRYLQNPIRNEDCYIHETRRGESHSKLMMSGGYTIQPQADPVGKNVERSSLRSQL